ncbi:bifunctional alpha/beta hydrolase/OsmC family protein [Croceiramulus getboli]|nr:bifunctional alpha/beta hydrolase/OsmC family protein [Flavobacteriaceae bacterium YJPT1-3]
MNTTPLTFKNAQGQQLSGKLELPLDGRAHNFALFAHCFTCTKNLAAVRNISRSLTDRGFAVLRFDFTGLGDSEGAFEDTTFSHNVADLVAASRYLEQEYKAPTLLIGHSLGGAAVIFAAEQLEAVEAIATIGAPASAAHVQHLFEEDIPTIQQQGEAVVQLGGRDFKIKKEFVDDLTNKSAAGVLGSLRKSLLILHAPQDRIVAIKNAEALYLGAHHPKSFVTLDGADHLLSKKEDSAYVGQIIASWASRYLDTSWKDELVSSPNHDVVAQLDGDQGFTTAMKLGKHFMLADEPKSVGGNERGPTPYELVSAGLSACTAMTIQMYARRKNWTIEQVEVHTRYDKDHAQDCERCENDSAKIDTFYREIKIKSDLDEKQIQRVLEIADKCPVHRTLESTTQVITTLNA